MKRVAYIIALVLVLTGSAMAQSSGGASATDDDFVVPPTVQILFTANGIEATKGVYDEVNEKCWGNTFSVKGSDGRSEAYQLTMSMDYLGQAGTDNKVVNGTWTLAVYKNGVFSGMLFGDITGGTIAWNLDGKGNILSRNSEGTLRVLGGTDYYEDVVEGSISGVFLLYSEAAGQKPTAKLSIQLGF